MFRFKKALEIRNTKKSVLVAAVAAVVVGATGTTAAAALQRQAPSGLGSQAVPSFYDRTWTFAGETSIDDGMLELGVDVMAALPSRFLGQGRMLADRDALLLTSPDTQIVDESGRPVSRFALDEAPVRVTGTLLRPSLWQHDGDGDVEPTIRVERIVVTRGAFGGVQLAPGFLSRTWTLAGETSIDDGSLELGVDAIADLPSQYLGEGSTLVRRNAVLVIGPETRIVDTRGRAFPRLALDEATVRVTGTLLQVSLWRNDGDGDLAPTLRVDRILVLHRDYDD